MARSGNVVEIIGKDSFQWLSSEFNEQTTLRDMPEEILDRIASMDIKIRDYAADRNAITCIAVITFAYKMANRPQEARFGAKDMLLLKVLGKNEKLRREGRAHLRNKLWDLPVCELITGEPGERIRAMRTSYR